jgi:hypothetical protein
LHDAGGQKRGDAQLQGFATEHVPALALVLKTGSFCQRAGGERIDELPARAVLMMPNTHIFTLYLPLKLCKGIDFNTYT